MCVRSARIDLQGGIRRVRLSAWRVLLGDVASGLVAGRSHQEPRWQDHHDRTVLRGRFFTVHQPLYASLWHHCLYSVRGSDCVHHWSGLFQQGGSERVLDVHLG